MCISAETEGASVRLAYTKWRWNAGVHAMAARQAGDNGGDLPGKDIEDEVRVAQRR